MIIVMKNNIDEKDLERIKELIHNLGLEARITRGVEKSIIGVVGDTRILKDKPIEMMNGVEKVVSIAEPYKLVSKSFKPERTVVKIDDMEIGGKEISLIAGPCAVESREQLINTAKAAKKGGAKILRGGAFKPRTSPYSFQGLEEEGLKILSEAKEITGLKIITEVTMVETISLVAKYADILQIGARNMQNFHLLKEVGRIKKPVMLKRGISATIEEWLNAAEYIMNEGNENVILCERGIRTFEKYTRNTLDLSAVPIVKKLSHLPIIVDPSHGTGKWELVLPMSRAAIAAGADGLIVEIHENPKEARSDGPQSLNFENYYNLCYEITKAAEIMEREFNEQK